MNASVAALPNSPAEIQKRVAAGRITWAGLLIMLAARSILAVICQALVAAIFFAGSADVWNEAGDWWRPYGTVIDVGCIVLLVWLARREGIRLFDLGSYSRQRWLRDVLIGLGLFVPVFLLLFVPSGILSGLAIYGGPAPEQMKSVTMVGFLYSLVIWPVIWAFAEDNTYAGYSLPRVEALTGRKWLAVVVVSFFWALQHSFMPFTLEWRHFVYRFVSSAPLAIVLCLLYLRQRRLLPMHIIHWLGNVVGVLMIMLMPAAGGG
jgi:membrane protease YdiL (CAAX protease family)